MKLKDRIEGLRRVRASDLLPNPKNWRLHPEAQQNAMRAMLADVGWASALIARETPDGLQLLDGHLRAEIAPEEEVPVLVVDLNDEEASKLLAGLDPIGAMAERDDEKLRSLLDEIGTVDGALGDLFASLAAEADAAAASATEAIGPVEFGDPESVVGTEEADA